MLDRPSINLQGGGHGELLEEEPLFLQNEKSLLYGKSFHGIPAALPAYSSPYFVDSGYSSGKVLDISGMSCLKGYLSLKILQNIRFSLNAIYSFDGGYTSLP